MIYGQLYLLLLTFLFGLHDGHSHKSNRKLTDSERKTWHRSGWITYSIAIAPLYLLCGWQIFIAAALIRYSIFDIGHNAGASIRLGYIGDGNEFWERLAIKIFKTTIIKAAVLLAVLIILNLWVIKS